MSFSTSVFGCFADCGSCCDVIWCGICNMGRQWNAVHGYPYNMSCCYCLLTCFFPVCSACCIRQAISEKYGLGETFVSACLCGWCCTACSMCQTNRELTLRGANPGGCCCSPSMR